MAGLAAGGAFLNWHSPIAARGLAAARFAASGRLGRIPLIELRVNQNPVGFRGQSIHALDLGLRLVHSTRGSEDSKCLPTRISAVPRMRRPHSGRSAPDAVFVTYDYGDMLLNLELRSLPAKSAADFRAVCYGTEGTLVVTDDGWEVHWKDGRTETANQGAPRNSEAGIARSGAVLCRLANISYRLGREIRFDPATGSIPDDAEANALLS
jgi:hypothetical protein